MNKKDLLHKLKDLTGLTKDEKAYLVNLVNTKKKYGLVWEHKLEDVEEALRTKLPILKEVKERAIINDTDTEKHPNHILIEGDNLHALTALTFTHENKIDLIYIDPPYNTGNKDSDGHTDFKYNDDYVDKDDEFRHSRWLSFMAKRLKIAKTLLKKDGFMAVSIDDNEIGQLKLLLDELFNDNTKIIAVKMSEASGLKMGATNRIKNIPKYKEYIVFAKSSGINDLDIEKIKKEHWDNEYNIFLENFTKENKNYINSLANVEIDEIILNKVDEILNNIKIESVSKIIKEKKITKKDTEDWLFENSWRICRTAASSSVKRLADSKRQYINQPYFSVKSKRDGILYIVKGDYSTSSKSPRVQFLFAEDNLMIHPGDFWSDIKTTGLEAEGGVEFKNGKKPLSLLNRILNAHLNKNSLILDFFAGSGSTLHSALKLNQQNKNFREVILVTNNENGICENTTYERVKNVILGYSDKEHFLDNNLRYYKTDFAESAKSEYNRRLLTKASVELLNIKENCYNEQTEQLGLDAAESRVFIANNLYLIIVFHSRNMQRVVEAVTQVIQDIPRGKTIKLYGFSPEKETLREEFIEVANRIEAMPLPDAIYNAYRNTFRTIGLSK